MLYVSSPPLSTLSNWRKANNTAALLTWLVSPVPDIAVEWEVRSAISVGRFIATALFEDVIVDSETLSPEFIVSSSYDCVELSCLPMRVGTLSR